MSLDPATILDIPITEPDSGATSLRHYFKLLLTTLWDEVEGFSSKRPFGNSSWDYDLALALIRAGVPVGTLDENGSIDTIDPDGLDTLIHDAVNLL